MINNKKIVAIIPARGGSKGIPNKNIKLIKNKPLIYYTIKAAKECKFIDNIIVSTDSPKIASITEKFGCKPPFLRPKSLATNISKTIECIIYCLNRLKDENLIYDIVIILQPTSPLRTSGDIKNAVKLFLRKGKNVASVNKIDINPYLFRTIQGNRLNQIMSDSSTIRRQDLPKYYKINGAIYVNDAKKITKNISLNDNEIGYIMDINNSIDIDSIDDLKKVKKILNKQHVKTYQC